MNGQCFIVAADKREYFDWNLTEDWMSLVEWSAFLGLAALAFDVLAETVDSGFPSFGLVACLDAAEKKVDSDSFDRMAGECRSAERLLVPAAEAEFVEVRSWNLKKNFEINLTLGRRK